MKQLVTAFLAAAVLALSAQMVSAATLDEVRERGFLRCGVHTGLVGFATESDRGVWTGFDYDFCRAVAAAVFGDPDKVEAVRTDTTERFTALERGEIDLLSRNTTWTLGRDASMNFAGVIYYDGQGFMINAANLPGINSALQLSGADICVQDNTTTALNLSDYFAANNMQYNPKIFKDFEETIAAYETGRCDVYTTDQSGLYALRLTLANPDDHVVLPEIISKEPLAPAVRHGDDQWFDIVKWTLFALIQAEELGITQGNVEELKSSDNPEIRRLLSPDDDSLIGLQLGLENDWVARVIAGVGNYGEIFERNIGQGSALKIARGLNQIWTKGGLQYAMPLR